MGTPLACGMDRAVFESLEPRQLLSAADLVGNYLGAATYGDVEDLASRTEIALHFTITNAGDEDAGGPGTGGFYLAFYWSNGDTHDAGDHFIELGLTEQDEGYSAADPDRYHVADALAAGMGSKWGSLTIPVPLNCPFQSANDGFIVMVVDDLDDVPETYEWNNTGRGLWRDAEYVAWDCLPQFVELLGDVLAVTEESAGECTVEFCASNYGSAAAGAFDIAFFWSDEPYLSPAALPVAIAPDDPNYDPQNPNIYHASGLDSWDFLYDSVSILLPGVDPFQTTGQFYLVMATDYGEGAGQVAEASEANNHSSFTSAEDTTTSQEWDHLFWPEVAEHYPYGLVGQGQDSVTFIFSEPMDPGSFSPAEDVVSFTGPSGDLRAQITGCEWFYGYILKVCFQALTEPGAYSMTIGPDIRAPGPFARQMDQDEDQTGGEDPDDLYTATFQVCDPVQEWTVMVYMAGDNNLEPRAIADINEMELALLNAGAEQGLPLPSINVVVQFDRIPGFSSGDGDWTDTRRGFIVADSNGNNMASQLTPIPPDPWGQTEANMGDPAVLREFVGWAVANFPAERYALILWDHGSALGGCCEDWTSNDELSMTEVGAGFAGGGQQIDLGGFDCCLMGILEQAYEIGPNTNVFVASEYLEPGSGWAYDQFLEDLGSDPAMTPPELAQRIVETYGPSSPHAYTLSAFNLPGLIDGPGSFRATMDALIQAIVTQAAEADYSRLQDHYLASTAFGADVRDIGEFVQGITEDTELPPAISDAAEAALAAYETARITWHASGPFQEATGLAVCFPWPGEAPDPGYQAIAPALCSATLWDEFLAWWDTGPAPRVGDWGRLNWPARPTELVLTYQFTEDVGATLDRWDFIVYNHTNSQTYDVPWDGLSYDGETFAAQLDLRSASLAAGWYEITLSASGVTDADGNYLDGNGDGVGGDDHVIANLMVPLGGDANLDGSVDVYDYLILKRNYGKTGMTWAEGDFNYDGAVNYYDMLIMKANFGRTIN